MRPRISRRERCGKHNERRDGGRTDRAAVAITALAASALPEL
jgi:hypothetical protein